MQFITTGVPAGARVVSLDFSARTRDRWGSPVRSR